MASSTNLARYSIEKKPSLWWDVWVGIVPLVTLLPMLLYEASELWSHEFMRFVPLTLLGVLAIVGVNWRTAADTRNPYRRWTAIGLLGLAVLIYLYSLWQFSPWWSHLALVVAFSAWALGRFGNLHWASVSAWGLLLATTIRLPGQAAQSVINGLQTFSTWATTKALDALEIPCISTGMLLETRYVSVLADEICGGWVSFFAFVSFAVFLAIVQRRSAVVLTLVLISIPMWTVIGHFLRLLTVALAFEYADRDMSVGWDYRLLEYATSGLVLFLIWMTASLLSRLLEPVPAADAEFGPIFSGLNKAFCWPQPDPLEDVEPEDEYSKKEYLRRKAKKEAQSPAWSPFDWQADARARWLVRLSAVVMLGCGLLPVSRLASQGFSGLNFMTPRISSNAVRDYASEESFPAELDGDWRRIGFERYQRSPRSGLGEFGIAWYYARGEHRFEASINLPFLGWHDPVAQRQLQGWSVEAEESRSEDGWVWVEADLENELGGRAYLLYCMYTPDAQPYSRLPASLAELRIESEERLTSEPQSGSATSLTYQFQVFSESGEPLSIADRERIRTKFLELRDTALGLDKSAPKGQATEENAA